jgi:ankyrin repeat protein
LIGAIAQYKFQNAEELVRAGASPALETYPGCNAATKTGDKAIEYWWLSHNAKTVCEELATLTATFKQMGHLAIQDRPPQTFDDWFGFLKKSVESGAKVNDYCLWEACKLGCLPIVQYLIAVGANVDFAPPNRSALIPHSPSALQMAIGNEFDEIALLLISAGADPDLKGGFLERPLELAVAN